jgi:hypothetical protein
MREFSAMRPAFRDPDAIGALADEIFVQPGDALGCARKIRRRDFGGFLARFRFAAGFHDDIVAWRLSHEESPCGVRLAPSVP